MATNVYRHKRLIATMLVHVALSFPHEPNCGNKRVLPQEKVWQLITSSLQ
jgi:hypothetical protein